MKRDYIRIGSEIPTMEGKIVVTGYNGHICTCDEFLWNDDTEESDIPNGCRNLTLDEIGKEMKYLDGQNHKVIFESEDE